VQYERDGEVFYREDGQPGHEYSFVWFRCVSMACENGAGGNDIGDDESSEVLYDLCEQGLSQFPLEPIKRIGLSSAVAAVQRRRRAKGTVKVSSVSRK
jgi:hypothetical protein